MNLAKLDKILGNGAVDFSAAMEVEARIFTSPTSKKDYYTAKNSAAQKASSASLAADNTK